MDGEEASFFALVDGEAAVAFGSAQDHKAVGDGDTGPNTGGMGAYGPAPVVTDAIVKQVGAIAQRASRPAALPSCSALRGWAIRMRKHAEDGLQGCTAAA